MTIFTGFIPANSSAFGRKHGIAAKTNYIGDFGPETRKSMKAIFRILAGQWLIISQLYTTVTALAITVSIHIHSLIVYNINTGCTQVKIEI